MLLGNHLLYLYYTCILQATDLYGVITVNATTQSPNFTIFKLYTFHKLWEGDKLDPLQTWVELKFVQEKC